MYTHRRQDLLNRRKLHPPTHHWELWEGQSLTAGHNRRRLEDMIASLSNHFRVFSRQTVQYAAWYSETHTSLYVVVPTSAACVVSDLKLSTNPVRRAGKTTLNSILTRVSGAPWHNYMCCAHTVKMAVNGVGSWGNWSTTWVKSTTLVSLEAILSTYGLWHVRKERILWSEVIGCQKLEPAIYIVLFLYSCGK